MTIDPEYTKHQFVYVPWVDGSEIDTVTAGKAVGLYVAQQFKVRPTILCATKSNANYHDEFKKLNVITERSGYVGENGVVIAWCPTRKVMQKLYDHKNIVVLVEWPGTRFDAWAKLVGAYNVVTREVMSANLNEVAIKALEGIVWEGYNGWSKDTDRILTLARLRELEEAGGYDRNIVLQYAEMKRPYGIDRLIKIVDDFERARITAA
ncbi:hypothetical protein [uncultured Microbacterium sp.]|uniref:hypothetical protein n=1 Tax=uncultured Microbacterium sp. TaxID=191216 RepID=UPI002627E7DB|nr:hypothetical protein [uncultured Microbacterium sp.]